MLAEMRLPTNVFGIENMAEIMTSCDLAIGAGGSTTWERCTLGIPTIQIETAENQRFINAAVSDAGAAFICNLSDLEQQLFKFLRILSVSDNLKNLTYQSAKLVSGHKYNM